MNPKLLRCLLVSAVVVGALAGLYYYTHAPLLRIRLKDGTEIRVLKVAYGTGANHEHELVQQSQLKLRLLHLLPQSWQSYFKPPLPRELLPANRMTDFARDPEHSVLQFREPTLSIWWVYDRPPEANDPLPPVPNGRVTLNPVLKGIVTHDSPVVGRLEYYLRPGEPDLLYFHLPPVRQKTFAVHLVLDNQSVDFTVPIPAPSE